MKCSDTRIRPAAERDLDRICEIDRLSFEKQWDSDKFRTALQDQFFVFEEDEVLGFLSACCSAVSNTAIILKIATHPDHRGRGIGTALIGAALDRLKALKVAEVELHVDIVKKGAIQLYEQFGFQIKKVVTADYEEEEAFYEMKLKLDGEDGVDDRLPRARQ